jgi:hypothetical protein
MLSELELVLLTIYLDRLGWNKDFSNIELYWQVVAINLKVSFILILFIAKIE